MIRLGCYEFIVCKGNVFKRIRKTKTHACLCCRAAVSFCNVALHLHLVIRLCANWAAVRQPVQALHGVIPASEPESWAASCVVLHCAIAGDAARNVSTMPPPAPRFWFAYAPIGRRFGIPCKHLLPSFRPPSGNLGRPYAGYWATLIAIPVSILAIASQDAGSVAGMTAQRGRGRKERAGKGVAPFCIAPRTSTLSFACAPIGRSLARQLGGGSAFRASTSSRHSGLRAGILGGLMRSIALHCRLAIVHPRQRLPRPSVGARGDRQRGKRGDKGLLHKKPPETFPAG